jgi:superfamily I DNA and/or RNA helicase
MQRQAKKMGMEKASIMENVSILSIDQCQGQEADFVLLSLVQRPTAFLDKHRFNVALSRVRKRLYLVTNRNEFRQASEDHKWECSTLARDLLQLPPTGL